MATTATEQAITKLDTLVRQNGALIETQAAPNLETELLSGKTALADAITAKGVETEPAESLTEMAAKIGEITTHTYNIDGGEMYSQAATADGYMWDLYKVLADIKSNPAYDKYTGILLGQFYKDSPIIELQNADGYLTSDGDYYESGQTHTWHDSDSDKVDRWVAFFLGTDGNVSSYTIPSSIYCPRTILIGRQINLINCTFASRIREVICPTDEDTIQDMNIGGTQSWNQVQVMPIEKKITGSLFYNAAQVVVLPRLKELRGKQKLFLNNYAGCQTLIMPALESALYDVDILSNGLGGIPSTIVFPKGFVLGLNKTNTVDYIGTNCVTRGANLVGGNGIFEVKGLTRLQGAWVIGTINSDETFAATEIRLPDLEYATNGILNDFGGSTSYNKFVQLKTIYAPKLTYAPTFIQPKNMNWSRHYINLIKVVIGDGFNSNLQIPYGARYLDDENKKQELLDNILHDIAMKVADRTGQEPLTFNVYNPAVRDILTEEIENTFAAKNWNISPAKSV